MPITDEAYGLALDRSERGVLVVELNRPEIHNAFDERLIASLTAVFEDAARDDTVGVVCLKGRGRSFCAGADLNWMRRTANFDRARNLADAVAFGEMLNALYSLPRTTLALAHGAVMGGGVGLLSCCDVAVAAADARFSLSETRLGLVPAVIGPYVVAAMGARHARRYMQSGERFDAATAMRVGLVHETVPSQRLRARGDEIIAELLKCGPNARRIAKELAFEAAHRPIDRALVESTAARIADARASGEGREGVAAFLEKRKPDWSPGGGSRDPA